VASAVRGRSDWSAGFTAIATCQADTSLFLTVFVVAPVPLVFTIGSVIYALIRHRQLRTILAPLAVLWAIAACFFAPEENPRTLPTFQLWVARKTGAPLTGEAFSGGAKGDSARPELVLRTSSQWGRLGSR
jgi:hypothetical protein